MTENEQIVLIADDEEAISSMLYKVIRSNGLQAETASSGEEALEKLQKKQYSLLLLDINMTGIDGFEVIQRIRSRNNPIPIIIISGRQEDYDTLYGLDIGADDYITKPFNPVIVGAKAKALLRRNNQQGIAKSDYIEAGPFRYNTSTLRFFKNEEEIILSARENALMKLFLDNVNRIFPKDLLYDMVWGDTIVDDNTVMVYINKLRQKIEDVPSSPVYIQTVRGLGYRFVI
ncbi:MAG: response regulator transcription factor [Lachnospiraceae bacterium]|nr:response regulator transcription factor [Lachnospiraceae bacterium]